MDNEEDIEFWRCQYAALLNEAHWLKEQAKALQQQRASVLQRAASVAAKYKFRPVEGHVETIQQPSV